MNDSNFMTAAEMINRVFKNIDPSRLNETNKLTNLWTEIVESIKSNSINGENIGKNIASHSRVIDLENGILLIEADHSGWIQMLGNYKKYIVRGFEMKAPELGIKTLAFRLTGSTAELSKIHAQIDAENERKNLQNRFEQERKMMEEQGFSENSENKKSELPPDIMKLFSEMENDMLTNSK